MLQNKAKISVGVNLRPNAREKREWAEGVLLEAGEK